MKKTGVRIIGILIIILTGCMEEPDINKLIQDLHDSNLGTARGAARRLAQMGPPAVEPLIGALQDKDSYAREYAVIALGMIKDPRAIKPLIRVFADQEYHIRYKAEQVLEYIGQPAVESLIEALQDEYYLISESAVRTLRNIKDPSAINPLVVALREEHRGSNFILGVIGVLESKGPLIEALQYKDPLVRKRAAEALGKIKDPRAIRPLIAVLKSEDRVAQEGGAEALGQIGLPAIEPLTEILKDKKPHVRRGAVSAFGRMYENDTVSILVAALKDDHFEVRKEAASWLGKKATGQEGAHAVEILMEALRDKKLDVVAGAHR